MQQRRYQDLRTLQQLEKSQETMWKDHMDKSEQKIQGVVDHHKASRKELLNQYQQLIGMVNEKCKERQNRRIEKESRIQKEYKESLEKIHKRQLLLQLLQV